MVDYWPPDWWTDPRHRRLYYDVLVPAAMACKGHPINTNTVKYEIAGREVCARCWDKCRIAVEGYPDG
jgi:hypothetical protein